VRDADADTMTCRVLDGTNVIVASGPCGANGDSAETRTATLADIRTHTLTLEVTDAHGFKVTKDLSLEVTAQPQIGNLKISKVEWGQTVMTANPRLVAGKDALLRVYVLSERAGISNVTVKATCTANG